MFLAPKKEHNPGIQGLRAIGAFLVMIFHIWIPKVSGGVDVFFVISGFLMSQVFLGELVRGGASPLRFWGNIAGRIVPTAYLVMALTVLASYWLVAPPYWSNVLDQFAHSAAQVQNWQLIEGKVNYLQRDRALSPFQQYWALSLQVQFYLALPFLLMLLRRAYLLAGQRRSAVFGLLALCWTASFGFAWWLTETDPNKAYFHSGARAWEFLTGVVLAFGYDRIRVSVTAANFLAPLGVVLLLATGILLPAGAVFPGGAALLPVAGAVLVIAFGVRATTPWFSWVRHPWLAEQGAYGFSIYLWHWPILVLTQNCFNTRALNLWQGLLVVALALVASRLSFTLVETPLRKRLSGRPLLGGLVALCLITGVLGAALGLKLALRHAAAPSAQELQAAVTEELAAPPSARFQPTLDLAGVPLRKLLQPGADVTRAVMNYCDLGDTSAQVIPCEFGDTKSERTVVLVGGSHASQWKPAFDIMGKARGFKLVSITKSACTLGLNVEDDPTCEKWNADVVAEIVQLEPELVIAVATRMPYLGEVWGVEYIPPGYLEKFSELAQAGISVLGLRDNPYFELNPYICAWIHSDELLDCARPREEQYLPNNPAQSYEASIPGFYAADLTEVFCPDGVCPVIIDDVLVWRDNHHVTRSYMRHAASRIERLLDQQHPGLLPQRVKPAVPDAGQENASDNSSEASGTTS